MARRIITERYLLQCDEIFAICNIGRAVTDKGVPEVLHLAKEARLSNVGIVCTRSDASHNTTHPLPWILSTNHALLRISLLRKRSEIGKVLKQRSLSNI